MLVEPGYCKLYKAEKNLYGELSQLLDEKCERDLLRFSSDQFYSSMIRNGKKSSTRLSNIILKSKSSAPQTFVNIQVCSNKVIVPESFEDLEMAPIKKKSVSDQ